MSAIAAYITGLAATFAFFQKAYEMQMLLILFGAALLTVSRRRGLALAGFTFFLGFVALTIIARPAMLHEPTTWLTLLVATFLGFGVGWSWSWSLNAPWRWPFVLAIVFMSVVRKFLEKLPTSDDEALFVVLLLGVFAGGWLYRLTLREAPSAAA